jgi:myosin V
MEWAVGGRMERDDLCLLEDLSEKRVVETLKDRYMGGKIYTRAGLVTLALNPHARLGIYGRHVMEAYFNRMGSVEPHIYDVAEACYQDMGIGGDQTIIISGESGSGKTESTKYVLDYFVHRTGSGSEIQRRIDAANVILEAFGNAQTRLNSNSSRLGKRVRLFLSGKITGASIDTYLLEKSRVTHQEAGERNFHIFYMLCAKRGATFKNDFIDTIISPEQRAGGYDEVLAAMQELRLERIREIEEGLLGILHLGSVSFYDEGTLKVVRDEHLKRFCSIYGLQESEFEDVLVKYNIKVRDETIEVYNTGRQAVTLRNSVARLLYANIFEHVVSGINRALSGEHAAGRAEISVLDIFGFEVFRSNGLDQLCINWTNERIQQEFVRRVFEEKQKMYKEEGVEWSDVAYTSNRSCVDAFERPCGIVDLIDEESLNAWGNAKNLGVKIRNYVKEAVRMNADDCLVVRHYAGEVEYKLDSFLEKNRERGDLRIFRSPLIKSHESDGGTIRYFKESMDALFACINETQIKYIRCIKPNGSREARVFEADLVLKQLHECGVVETIRISRQCFPQEMGRERFNERYGLLGECGLVRMKEGRSRVFMDSRSLMILEVRRSCFIEEQGRRMKKALREYMGRTRKRQSITFIDDSGASCGDVVVADEIEVRPVEEAMDGARVKELLMKLEKFKKFCNEPCRNCKVLETKYKFQSEALKKKRLLELELDKYKARVEYLEGRLMEKMRQEDTLVSLSFTNVHDVFGCLLQLFLEYAPAFCGNEVPRLEMLSLAHSAFYVASKLGGSENTVALVDEVSLKLRLFEKDMHKVCYVLSNLIEYQGLLRGVKAEGVQELDSLVEVLFRHVCELQRSSLLEVLPQCVLDHQQVPKFRCNDGYLRRIFRPPSVGRLVRLLEYFYYQMAYYHLPEAYVLESVNHMLKTVNASVFNGLLVKKRFLSFNRGVQINFNINEIIKFCHGIGYLEGMLNLGHVTSTIKLINLVEARASADSILNECSFLNCAQIREVISKFSEAVEYDFAEDSRNEAFIPDFKVSLPRHLQENAHQFVCPRYLPAESLHTIFKSIR